VAWKAEGFLDGIQEKTGNLFITSGKWQMDPAELHRVYPPKGQAVTESEPLPDTFQTAEVARHDRHPLSIDGLKHYMMRK
jgi:hypothetical protein